jgi:hypothetical protein
VDPRKAVCEWQFPHVGALRLQARSGSIRVAQPALAEASVPGQRRILAADRSQPDRFYRRSKSKSKAMFSAFVEVTADRRNACHHFIRLQVFPPSLKLRRGRLQEL